MLRTSRLLPVLLLIFLKLSSISGTSGCAGDAHLYEDDGRFNRTFVRLWSKCDDSSSSLSSLAWDVLVPSLWLWRSMACPTFHVQGVDNSLRRSPTNDRQETWDTQHVGRVENVVLAPGEKLHGCEMYHRPIDACMRGGPSLLWQPLDGRRLYSC